MKDRSTAPPGSSFSTVNVTDPGDRSLSNGIPLTLIDMGSQDLCRIEFIFDAGTTRSAHPLLASFANDLIDEGTKNKTSEEIAEHLDYYGAFVETEAHFDHASVFVFTLNKHLGEVLPAVSEFIRGAVYPAQDVRTYISNQRQKFLVAEEKVNYVCRKKFNEALFGPDHGYGRNVSLEDYDTLTVAQLRKFHAERYDPGHCRIMVAGKINKACEDLLDTFFGKDWKSGAVSDEVEEHFLPGKKRCVHVHKKDALQSAIRIGRVLFNRHHPDFADMQVVNTILGGYFGSRLMANIREDKGYTYGIGSGISSMLRSGTFAISTEVGAAVCRKALKEIYAEIRRLREEPVGDNELETVRNYMLGTWLSSIDGPFQVGDRIRILRQFGLNNGHFNDLLNAIKTITPQRILELAGRYLQEEDLKEVVVGNK